MQVTSVGHAGFHIRTEAGSILCDPWVNPAYFASWFPFPDNSGLDWDALGDVDYLYVSHLHKDHFDPEHADASTSTRTPSVLLPDYPGAGPAARTREAGLPPSSSRPPTPSSTGERPQGRARRHDHRDACPCRRPDRRLRPGGLRRRDHRVQHERRAPDRPGSDARGVRPHRHPPAAVLRCHLVPDGLRHARPRQGGFGNQKRQRADGPLPQYIEQVGATWVVPSAGPPCFLDRRSARPQRRPRRPGEHLPRPDRVPRADAHPRPRRWPADDSRVDRGFHWPAS